MTPEEIGEGKFERGQQNPARVIELSEKIQQEYLLKKKQKNNC
jgi:hypothetical protein